MLNKINKIANWQAALIITTLGFLVFFVGLHGQFLGDDLPQIVNNVPVHSVANIHLFFEGGTFYNGHGLAPLSGVYFRPLMTTVFRYSTPCLAHTLSIFIYCNYYYVSAVLSFSISSLSILLNQLWHCFYRSYF